MSDHAVNVSRVTKIYGQGRTAFKALDEINLAVEQGGFLAIMGPSGSGKSTLLNIIGGLDRPTAGEVYLGNTEVTGQPESQLFQVRREQIGFVFQSFHLSPILNALDNVLLPALPIGVSRQRRERAKELLDRMGLVSRMQRKPGELSTGERQRVALARALILDPAVLLADEPTGNLDSHNGAEVIRLLADLNRDVGKTILLVTHDPRVARHCRRVIFLRDGRLCSEAEAGLEEAV